MSEDPATFRDNYAGCDWIFDLFAYGFDCDDGHATMSVQGFRFGRAVFDESIFSILFLSAISAGASASAIVDTKWTQSVGKGSFETAKLLERW